MNTYNNYPRNLNYFTNILPTNQEIPQDIEKPYEGFLKGNMFSNLYDPYKSNKVYQIEPLNEQANLLTQIDALSFACIDLNLYLDVNPDDRNSINLFNQYRVQEQELKNIYEKEFGPLNLESNALNAYPWIWDSRPWPWEN